MNNLVPILDSGIEGLLFLAPGVSRILGREWKGFLLLANREHAGYNFFYSRNQILFRGALRAPREKYRYFEVK